MFRVGQKVVRIGSCSDGEISASRARQMGYSFPEMGDVVTIKTLNVWPHRTILTFHEHDNSHIQKQMCSYWEPGFDASAFRPVVERKTDISCFTEILRKVNDRAARRALASAQVREG